MGKLTWTILESTKLIPHMRMIVELDGKTVYAGTFMSIEGCRSKLKELKIKYGAV